MFTEKTLLIVEDETLIKKAIFKRLSKSGYKVITSSSIAEAQLFCASDIKIDGAIIDLNLPDGDGLSLIEKIKSNNSSAEIIVLTGFGTIELALSASKKGVFHFMTKPFEMNALEKIIERAVNHKELQTENRALKAQINSISSHRKIIGQSNEIRNVTELAYRISDSDSTVMINGESGTGKELIAKMIHENSPRKSGSFITVNCGALPEDLLESELFGHKKGSFTGAYEDRPGRFCLAEGGTLFLDEVGDMSPKLQVKLLRVLQEKTYEPVGSGLSKKSNIRLIAATHKDLAKLVEEGLFREDLYYRLNVIPIQVPALRNRKSDIPLLINHFIQKFNFEKNRSISGLSTESFLAMTSYNWPGNIRELENLMERLIIIKRSGMIQLEDLPSNYKGHSLEKSESNAIEVPDHGIDFNNIVNEFENKIILKALQKTGWNKNQAAILLRLNRTTLIEKIKKKGLKPPIDFEI